MIATHETLFALENVRKNNAFSSYLFLAPFTRHESQQIAQIQCSSMTSDIVAMFQVRLCGKPTSSTERNRACSVKDFVE